MAEDRRIALAALAVTAIVGIAAPVGTLVVTNAHDDNVLEREQAQADRTELRRVLDDATEVIGNARAVFLEVMRDGPIRDTPQRRRVIRKERIRLDRTHDRLAIRLGRHSRLAARMDDVLAVSIDMQHALLRTGQAEKTPEEDLDDYDRAAASFVDAANRVARLSTD